MRGKNILKTLVVTTVLALSMTTIHAADTNVSFDGDAEDFIFLDGSQDLFDNFKNIIYSDNELFGYLDRTTVSKFTELNKVKINTFANFKQNENIDLLEFFKREFNYKLAITYSEYCYLNDNTY